MEILHVLCLISILNELGHFNTQSGVNSQGSSVPKHSSQELNIYYDMLLNFWNFLSFSDYSAKVNYCWWLPSQRDLVKK